MDHKAELEHFVVSLQTLNRYLRSTTFDKGNQSNQPVTRVQWLLLRHLHRKGGTTIGQLAAHLDVRASTMSQMLDRLEKAGYVYRQSDTQDARVKTVNLSDNSKAIITHMEANWIESLAEPFSHLSSEEREQLVETMQKLLSQLPKRDEV